MILAAHEANVVACVHTTPFGKPVVPDEYTKSWISLLDTASFGSVSAESPIQASSACGVPDWSATSTTVGSVAPLVRNTSRVAARLVPTNKIWGRLLSRIC